MGIPSSFDAAAARRAFDSQDADFDASLEKTQEAAKLAELTLDENAAEAAQEKLAQEEQENASTGMMAPTKKLIAPPRSEKIEKAKEVQESVLVRKEDADQFAGDFMGRGNNKHYHVEVALLSALAQELGVSITPKMSSTEIIDHVVARLRTIDPNTGKQKDPDSAQVDKTFEFLIYAAERQLEKVPKDSAESKRLTEVAAHIKVAKDIYYNMPGPDGKPNGKAIDSAQKIIGLASGIVDESELSTKEALDQLRNILDNPQTVQDIRKHYEANGGYQQLFVEIKEFFHHLGSQLKRVNVKTVEGDNLNPTNMPTLEPVQLQQYAAATKERSAMYHTLKSAKEEAKVSEKTMYRAGYIDDPMASKRGGF